MFEGIQGLTPERAAKLTALVEQFRPVLSDRGDMDAVQRLLDQLGTGVIESVLVTRELLGAGSGSFPRAKEIVVSSPARGSHLPTHQQFVETLERARDIADAARSLHGTLGSTLIAIDGPGGSGKTTLAAEVAKLLDGATVVPGDDFYRPMPDHEREELSAEQGYHRYFDWERLRDHVLSPLRRDRTARYQSFDWATGRLEGWHEIQPGTGVIVEGVYSARPELAPYYHLTTYVDTPRELCLRRLRRRGQDHEEWITRWRAAEDYYLRTTWPQTRVRLLVRGY